MVVGGGGQVRIKGETRWRRRDVSNKRPGVPTLAIWDGDILGYSHTEQYLGGEYIKQRTIFCVETFLLHYLQALATNACSHLHFLQRR